MKYYWGDLKSVAFRIIQQIPLSVYRIHNAHPQSGVFFCKKAACKAYLGWETILWISQMSRSLNKPALETGILQGKASKQINKQQYINKKKDFFLFYCLAVQTKIVIGPGICWYSFNSNTKPCIQQPYTYTHVLHPCGGFQLTRAPAVSVHSYSREEGQIIWAHVVGSLTVWKGGLAVFFPRHSIILSCPCRSF